MLPFQRGAEAAAFAVVPYVIARAVDAIRKELGGWTMRRFGFLLIVLVPVAGAGAQPEPEAAPSPAAGWVRTLAQTEKGKDFYTWTLADSGGRGATLIFTCNEHGREKELRIETRESLLDMADVEDGQIKAACLSPAEDRQTADAVLALNQHGAVFKSEDGQWITAYLRHEQNLNQTVTFLLSNNGKRETYTFENRGSKIEKGEDPLSCEPPKKPKRK